VSGVKLTAITIVRTAVGVRTKILIILFLLTETSGFNYTTLKFRRLSIPQGGWPVSSGGK